MFDGSVVPRRRVSLSKSPSLINKDKDETIKKYKNGFIERKRWKIQMLQQLNILKNQTSSDNNIDNIWKMVRISYFARIIDFEILNILSNLVDMGKITKDSQHIFLLRLFIRLLMTSETYKNTEYIYPLINILITSRDIHNKYIPFLAHASSIAISRGDTKLLDKLSLIFRNFGNGINCAQFHLTFWGNFIYPDESLTSFNLNKIFASMAIQIPDCLINAKQVISTPFNEEILCKNINSLLNNSTDGDFIQLILFSLSYIPNILDNIKTDWSKIFKIIGSSRKGSLFIAIKYSKYLKDEHLSSLATCFFSSKLIKCIRDHYTHCCNSDISNMNSVTEAIVLFCRIYMYVDMILYDSEIINGFFSTIDNAKWIGYMLTRFAVYIDYLYNDDETNSKLNHIYAYNSIICNVSKKIALRLSRMNIIKSDDWIVNEYLDKNNPFPPVPHAIPFSTRVNSLRQLTCFEIDPRFLIYNRPYLIRRTHIVEDSLETLGQMNPDALRLPFRVAFVDEFGNPEDGIDGGGIFKEFLLTLSKSIFDPSYGLFQISNDSDMSLFPSITSGIAHENHLEMFNFVGIIVGKAIFEGILIEPVLSRLLLNLILGHRNGFDELQYFDPQLHKHLLKLISLSDNELLELDLNFTTTINSLGIIETHELLLDGDNKRVNRSNVHEYIWRLANFKCNTLIESQCTAFLSGLSKIIPLEWLRNFSPTELQLLISGSPLIDVQDMRKNTVYSGYTADSLTIKYFWEIVEQHDMKWRSEFLAFITSCKRAPLLGFAHLKPQICITLETDIERLPTSSTCTNLLKLPDFKNKQLLSNKLDVALSNCHGFLLD